MNPIEWMASPVENKMYRVVLASGCIVDFGDKTIQHYHDRTPLQLYSHLDHLDQNKRKWYWLEVGKKPKWNLNGTNWYPDWFVSLYLW